MCDARGPTSLGEWPDRAKRNPIAGQQWKFPNIVGLADGRCVEWRLVSSAISLPPVERIDLDGETERESDDGRRAYHVTPGFAGGRVLEIVHGAHAAFHA
jgi:hypothetical protein